MDQNLYAYTELTCESYPGYVSINERQGGVCITVREPGQLGLKSASLTISRPQARAMAELLLLKLAE